jgi:hypothetical protein
MVLPRLAVAADDLPKHQPRLRIETRGRLVEEQHLGIVHHGARDGEPLHQAARQFAGHLAGAVGEFELLQLLVGAARSLPGALTKIGAVKQQHLAGSQRKIQVGPLRHHADQALGLDLLLPDVELADERAAAGGLGTGGQDADGSGLARPVRPQQTEDFAGGNLQ